MNQLEQAIEQANKNIKLVMFDSSMTQEKLAKKTGIPFATLIKKLNNRSEWRYTEMCQVAKALNTEVSILFFGKVLPIGNKVN